MKNQSLFVISVGGSLIVPDDIDAAFVKKFKSLIIRHAKKGSRFILIAGGGKVCRRYQAALKAAGTENGAEDLDWMGIYVTHANAEFLRLAFGKLAHPAVIKDPGKKAAFSRKIMVAGGWKPGRSTDYGAVMLARLYGSAAVVNLSNIDYVYDKDPRKFKDAEKIERISWKNFRKNIVGAAWKPGANYPFDPVASKLAEQSKIRVIIANGKNLKNLERILSGKTFMGTVIE